MKYKIMGDHPLKVSEIGFGAWGIGGLTEGYTSYGETDDAVSIAALEYALDTGINFFDTSNVYGNGRSEKLIGEVFAGKRGEVFLATKAGFSSFHEPPNFSCDSIRASITESLSRLRTDHLDLIQLHNITAGELERTPKLTQMLDELKTTGTTMLVGASVKTPSDAISILELYPFDVIQANFNMMDIRVITSGLFEKLRGTKTSFIARTPLAFGFLTGCLTGSEQFPEGDHRNAWSRDQLSLWGAGSNIVRESCVEFPQAPAIELALRFCISYEEVTTVIPGMLTPVEVKQNVEAIAAGPLIPESLKAIETIHQHQRFVVS